MLRHPDLFSQPRRKRKRHTQRERQPAAREMPGRPGEHGERRKDDRRRDSGQSAPTAHTLARRPPPIAARVMIHHSSYFPVSRREREKIGNTVSGSL
jgi:hypothetical protein